MQNSLLSLQVGTVQGRRYDFQGSSSRAAAAAVRPVVTPGPVPREGGRGGGKAAGTSVYTRDPDGNLLEFIVYR